MPPTTVEISKEITFEAAHYLHNPKWDRKKNLETFRKCSGYRADNPSASHLPHGHSYRLRVTVKGAVSKETGFVMDFRLLKEILKREVYANFDHRFINREVAPFKGDPKLQTTAENIAQVVWGLLDKPIRAAGARLSEVRLWETPDSCATLRKS